MTEPVLVLTFLNPILTQDPVLVAGVVGGWHRVAPAGVQSPFGIVRQHMAAEDLTGLDGGRKIWVPGVYQVNLYDRKQRTFARIDPLAQRVYELLQGIDGTAVGGIIYGIHRVGIEAGDEQVPGTDTIETYITQRFGIEAVSA
jgi:hypothetical protein